MVNSVFACNTIDDLLSYLEEHRPCIEDPIKLDKKNAGYLDLDEDDFADINTDGDTYITLDELMLAANEDRGTKIFSEGDISLARDIIRYRDELLSKRRGGYLTYASMLIPSIKEFVKRDNYEKDLQPIQSLPRPEWFLRLKEAIGSLDDGSYSSFSSARNLLDLINSMLSQGFDNEEIFLLLDSILARKKSSWRDNLLEVAGALAERKESVQDIIGAVGELDSMIADDPQEDFFIIYAFNEMMTQERGSSREAIALLKDVKTIFGRLDRSFLDAAQELFANGMARDEIIATLKQFRLADQAVFYSLSDILKVKPLEKFITLKEKIDDNICYSAENGAYSSLAPLISAGWSDERIIANYSAIGDYFGGSFNMWACWRAYEALVPYAKEGMDEKDALRFIKAYQGALSGEYDKFPHEAHQSLFAGIRSAGAPFEEAFDFIKWLKSKDVRSPDSYSYAQYFYKMKAYGFSYREAIDTAKAVIINTPQHAYEYIHTVPDWLLLGFRTEDVIDIVQTAHENVARYEGFLDAIYEVSYDPCIDVKKTHDLIVKVLEATGDYEAAISLFKLLWIPNVNEDASIEFLEELKRIAGEKDLSDVVAAWLAWGVGMRETLDILKFINAQLVPRHQNQSEYSYKALKSCYFNEVFRNFEENRTGLGLLTRYGQEDLSTAYRAASLLNLDLTSIKDKTLLADEIISKANKFFADLKDLGELRDAAQELATSINFMHDVEGELGEGDSIRNKITAELSLEAVYYLLSLGGGSLYTSTFNKLFSRLDRASFKLGFSQTIKQERTFPLFVMTLSRFAHLSEAYDWQPEYFEKSISKMLSEVNVQKLINNASLITSAVRDILASNATPKLKDYLEGLLVERYSSYKKYNDSDRMAAIGFLMKVNEGHLKNKEAVKIAKGLPEIPRLSVPKIWYKDGKLALGVYFYQEWFYNHFISFFSERGFSKKQDKAHTVLKGGVEGLNVELDVFFGPPSKGTSFKDFEMVFHRGHSHQSESTFVGEMMTSDEKQRLYYDGGCGGLDRVLSRQQANPNDLFMGDLDMGQGMVNTPLTYQLIRAIALARANKNFRDWAAVKKNIERKMKLPGIIFPDEEGLQVRAFVQATGHGAR